MSDLIPLLNVGLPLDMCKYIRQVRRELFYKTRVQAFESKYAAINYIKQALIPDNRKSNKYFYTVDWRRHNIRYRDMTGHDIITDHLLFLRAVLNDDPRAIDRGDFGAMMYRDINFVFGRKLF